MKLFRRELKGDILKLLEIPSPDPIFFTRRMESAERNIVLPIKAIVVGLLVYYFYFSGWSIELDGARGVAIERTEFFFRLYLAFNALELLLLWFVRRVPLALVQWGVFAMCLLDALFLSALTLVTGGFDSLLYWVFLGLVIRNSICVPASVSQLVLNFCVSFCYIAAGGVDLWIGREEEEAAPFEEGTMVLLGMGLPDNPAEPFLLRLMMLWLLTVCLYGVQMLVQRERAVAEEQREFAVRHEQLRSAGRLAAEIAHQLKNPLGIINTAVYSLRRSLTASQDGAMEQVRIIQEEVERSDRIISRLISDGRMSEGQVEKLDVIEELDKALREVFPKGAPFEVTIHRDFARQLPYVLMQRNHLSEIFLNLLQNAREALNGKGNIWIEAHQQGEYSVEVAVRDDGPGIPADKLSRVFEAYYTSKEGGSGLGLAIARHNAELYGGTLEVQSELGKGARFTLVFPSRALIHPSK